MTESKTEPKSSTHQNLEVQALRDALERAGKAAAKSQEAAAKAISEWHSMRHTHNRLQVELQRVAKESDHILEENKRLRSAIAELYRERELLRERVKAMSLGASPSTTPQKPQPAELEEEPSFHS